MKKILALLFALIGWFAVIAQLCIMIADKELPVTETLVKFFSYFTILTNIIVAVYFTGVFFSTDNKPGFTSKPGTLTAITVYIFIVGIVYQLALRHIWNPQGLQRVVDELLHSVIPVLTIIFWFLYEVTKPVKYQRVFNWAIYPLAYLVFILIRGNSTSLYPYYFVDVTKLGMQTVLLNAAILLIAFLSVAAIFLFTGKKLLKK
jgi:hypothetical protein